MAESGSAQGEAGVSELLVVTHHGYHLGGPSFCDGESCRGGASAPQPHTPTSFHTRFHTVRMCASSRVSNTTPLHLDSDAFALDC